MRTTTKVYLLWLAIATSGFAFYGYPTKAQSPGAIELVRSSDFVGIVMAEPMVTDPSGEWKQHIYLYQVEPLKGILTRDSARRNQYPWVYAGNARFWGYPTWFTEKGEYLVFLGHGLQIDKEAWTTTAALCVEYRPDKTGHIVGEVVGGKQRRVAMNIADIRSTAEQIIARKTSAKEAARPLDRLLQNIAASSGGADSQHESTPYEDRYREARILAGNIRMGTTRADIEKMFPLQDGGLSISSSTRYYLGSEVMVEVPFDPTGGAWKSQNRVNGPLRVYRSFMHIH
jgi:hypothetical protein